MISRKTQNKMNMLASEAGILMLALYDQKADKFLLLPVTVEDDPTIDAQLKRAVDEVGAVPVANLAFTPLEYGQYLIQDERFPGVADAIVNRARQLFEENLLQAGIIKPVGVAN